MNRNLLDQELRRVGIKIELFEFISGGYVLNLKLNVVKADNWLGFNSISLEGLEVVCTRKFSNIERQVIIIPSNKKEFRDYIKRHIEKYGQGEEKAVQDLINCVERYDKDKAKENLLDFLKQKGFTN